MEFINNLGWVGKSVVSMMSLVPFFILFAFFYKQGLLKPEAMVFGWFLGVIVGMLMTSMGAGVIKIEGFSINDLSFTGPMISMIVFGIVIGALGNLFMGQAM
ncbi:hypothetical protein ACFL22_01160, partial [Patescibacteria group bacterium]